MTDQEDRATELRRILSGDDLVLFNGEYRDADNDTDRENCLTWWEDRSEGVM